MHKGINELPLIECRVLDDLGQLIGDYEFPVVPCIGDRVRIGEFQTIFRVYGRQLDSLSDDNQMEIWLWVEDAHPNGR